MAFQRFHCGMLKQNILGCTHPNERRDHGEAYRQFLQNKAYSLGISQKVHFVDQYLTESQLTQYLRACDIYVTPYPNEDQISSGTLSFAVGAGAAVISTPYWYAKELLGQGRGLLFDFYDGNGLAQRINKLLISPRTMNKFRRRARRYGRGMQWPLVGRMYTALIQQVFCSKDHGADVFPEATLTNLPLFGASTSNSIEVSSNNSL